MSYYRTKMNNELIEFFKKFFMDLANDNLDNYHELLTFCKNMINETLEKNKPIIHILGNGLNGKSTLMRVLRMLQDKKMVSIPKYGLSLSFFSNIYHDDLRYIEMADVEHNDIKKIAGTVKEMVGGDTIYIRKLYKMPETVKPNLKFIFVTNYAIDLDAGFKHRTKTIKMEALFDNVHKQQNVNIFDELIMHRDQLKKFILNYGTDEYISYSIDQPLKDNKLKTNEDIDDEICISITI